MNAIDTDPDQAFYHEIAQYLGRELTLDEKEVAYHTRKMACYRYEKQGLTPPPSNLVGQTVWLITQDRLYREELNR